MLRNLPRRDKLQIKVDTLKAISVDTIPTKIMYGANLSWGPLQKILNTLKEEGLITETDIPYRTRTRRDKRSKKTYSLTNEGVLFLQEAKRFTR